MVSQNSQGVSQRNKYSSPKPGPFRPTLTKPAPHVDNISPKSTMLPQSFCGPPPCPPMCPPFCFPPCPPSCMPFPCNPCCPPPPWSPPYCPPPPPCFPPPCCPPPCYPPPCCPPPCCPTGFTRKCFCISGNKKIICVPRGRGPPCNPCNPCLPPCDPCNEKPACYNNCNFYVSENQKCWDPCAPEDSCAQDPCGGNDGLIIRSGKEQIYPPCQGDKDTESCSDKSAVHHRASSPHRNKGRTKSRSHGRHKKHASRHEGVEVDANNNHGSEHIGYSRGKSRQHNSSPGRGCLVSAKKCPKDRSCDSDQHSNGDGKDSKKSRCRSRSRRGQRKKEGNCIGFAKPCVQPTCKGNDMGTCTTVNDNSCSSRTPTPPPCKSKGCQSTRSKGTLSSAKKLKTKKTCTTRSCSEPLRLPFRDRTPSSRVNGECERGGALTCGTGGRKMKTCGKVGKKCRKKKKVKRCKSDSQVNKCKPVKPPTCIGFGSGTPRCTMLTGGPEKPIRIIYQRECNNPCPPSPDTCDYTYRNTSYGLDSGYQDSDNCSHLSPAAAGSPCGLCYRDYDVCPAGTADSTRGQRIILGARPVPERSRTPPGSPDLLLAWRREDGRTRQLRNPGNANVRTQNPRTGTRGRGLPIPGPPDMASEQNPVDRAERQSARRSIKCASSSKSADLLDVYSKGTSYHWNRDMNRNRSPASRPSLRANATRSMLDISDRNLIRVKPIRSRSWSRPRSRRSVPPKKVPSATTRLVKVAPPVGRQTVPRKADVCNSKMKMEDKISLMDYWHGPSTAEVYRMSIQHRTDDSFGEKLEPRATPPVPKPRKMNNTINLPQNRKYIEWESEDTATETEPEVPSFKSVSGQTLEVESEDVLEIPSMHFWESEISMKLNSLLTKPARIYSPPQVKKPEYKPLRSCARRNQEPLTLARRGYSPGEFLVPSDFSDSSSIVALCSTNVLPPTPKPRKSTARRNPCRELSSSFIRSENLPSLPYLDKINGTNVYRPSKEEGSKPQSNSHGLAACPISSGSSWGSCVEPATYLDLTSLVKSCQRPGFHPLRASAGVQSNSSCPPPTISPRQGHQNPLATLPNYSRKSELVLPNLPNPRSKPRSLGPSPRASKPKLYF